MSPRLRPPIGGRGEEDSDEREGVAPGGSVRTGSQWVIAVAGCCGNFVAQLSPGQASVETIPARRAGESAHGNAGRPSQRAKPSAFREEVLQLVRAKYSGTLQERF